MKRRSPKRKGHGDTEVKEALRSRTETLILYYKKIQLFSKRDKNLYLCAF